jgi:hypothetical protein
MSCSEFYNPTGLLDSVRSKVNQELVLVKQHCDPAKLEQVTRLERHLSEKYTNLHKVILEIENIRKKLAELNRLYQVENMDTN